MTKSIEAFALIAFRGVAEGILNGAIAEFGGNVLQGEDVVVGGVLEVVEDAVLLHQPGDEGEVALAILRAVFELGIGVGGVVSGTDAVGREDLLDDVDDRHVLEDTGVLAERKQPQFGNDVCLVVVVLVIAAAEFKAGYDAVDVTLRP